MTYSYVRQSWVEEQINKEIFGITLISRIAQIPEATGKTWLRQASYRLPPHKKMPREYERAMGILLLEKYPDCLKQISSMVFTNPRTLKEWVTEDRHHWVTSDLRKQTHALIKHLRPQIPEFFALNEKGEIILTKNRWPDSRTFEKEFHEILDLILYFVVEIESNYRFNKISSDFRGLMRLFSPEMREKYAELPKLGRKASIHVPVYGPHRYRYATKLDADSHRFDWSDTRAYQPGKLRGVNLGGYYDPHQSAHDKLQMLVAKYGDTHQEVQVLADVIELKEFLAQRDAKWQADRQMRDSKKRESKREAS